MKVEFDIKMTASDLYDYMLHHTYSGFSGMFGSFVGILFLFYFFSSGVWLHLIAGLVILFYIPCSLFMRAQKQVLANEAFREPLHYELTEEGITVKQGEAEQFLEWDMVVKAVSTNRSILIYTSKVNAWIFPKRILAEKRIDVIRMISTHVSPEKVKIKQ